MNASRIARASALLAVLAVTAGCGGGYGYDGYDSGHDDYYAYGAVEMDNLTDTTTFEDVYGFYLAPAATGAFTDNLLFAPVPPGVIVSAGEFLEDAYDGEADLEFGDLVTWFDVLVPAEAVTTFEVF
jgi:hypothetical protein